MIITIMGTVIVTIVVFVLGINIGFKLAKEQPPIALLKKEDIPLTKEHREKKQELDEIKNKVKQYEEIASYIETFGEDDL